LLSFTAVRQRFVVVNDPKVALEMLDKKGKIYADRPELPMVNLSGWDRQLSQLHYGPQLREYRKVCFAYYVALRLAFDLRSSTAVKPSCGHEKQCTQVPSHSRPPIDHVDQAFAC
jgi:hypothetical protein